MEFFQNLSQWFTGGSEHPYMTLYHCMQHDTFWIGLTVVLDLTVAAGYVLIALHWWKNQQRVPPTPARAALGSMRDIFIFCGLCGYLFIPIKMFWPAWRLYDMFLAVLAFLTWRYALRTKDLKVVYNELGRTNQLSEELERSRNESRQKTHFLNSLSHDLRTPLNALVLQSQVARISADQSDVQSLKTAISEIEINAQATAELLTRLLECARLDWSEEPNALTQFKLEPMLRDLVQPFVPEATQKNLSLQMNCPSGVTVKTDRVKLERILNNLVANALKFTEHGSVRVVAECAGGAVEIHVIDTGVGISPEQQAHLFQEFYQVQNHARDRKKGFGLGLSISRRLARQLGGEVEVHSSTGSGSRFSVLLPGAITQPDLAELSSGLLGNVQPAEH